VSEHVWVWKRGGVHTCKHGTTPGMGVYSIPSYTLPPPPFIVSVHILARSCPRTVTTLLREEGKPREWWTFDEGARGNKRLGGLV
jgi:hypothetical protein